MAYLLCVKSNNICNSNVDITDNIQSCIILKIEVRFICLEFLFSQQCQEFYTCIDGIFTHVSIAMICCFWC